MPATPPSDRAYTVLLVDDNPDLILLLSAALRKLGGFTVVTATNGYEGLERFDEARPDCVVMDVRMPGMDGYQLTRLLRGDPQTAPTPLILLTAMAQTKDQLAGMLSGADAYLVKPIKPLDLIAAIRRVIAVNAEQRRQRMESLSHTPLEAVDQAAYAPGERPPADGQGAAIDASVERAERAHDHAQWNR